MIYQTGTIATTSGQTKIKGTGTRWKDNLAGISEGCPISYLINNVVYMNTVLSVNSDTEINLTYPVPVAASAAKYQIATFVLDSMSDGVRKIAANQLYIEYFLRNMDTWMTQDGIVEIKTPTGETVKLESIIALKKLIDGKYDKKGGQIDGPITSTSTVSANKKIETYNNELEVYSLLSVEDFIPKIRTKQKGTPWAEHYFQNKSGTLMLLGDFGWGGNQDLNWNVENSESGISNKLKDRQTQSQIHRFPSSNVFASAYTTNAYFKSGDTWMNLSADKNTGVAILTVGTSSTFKITTLYSTANTTKDANGNLKAASPVIKVYSDHIELNDESEGVELEKLGTGRYKLKGTLGMNSDASWGGIHGGLVVPNGINNLPLVWADFDVLPDGDIIIETRYRKHTLHPRLEAQRLMTYPEFLDENNVEREDYDYCDIPNGHWIDVRVNMPSDSIYNQKLAEAERLAKIEAERVAKEDADETAREEAERSDDESKQEQASKLEE
ncbi:TPA: hypothetical protein ACS70H_000527 [Providencia alcalifaciens]